MHVQILTRLLDLITLAMLVSPYQSARTFAVVLIWFLVFAGFLAAVGMTKAIASSLSDLNS